MAELKRTVGPGQMMLYGIGSMLGAGIYGLVGRAAGVMGGAMWLAFLLAMTAALLTGCPMPLSPRAIPAPPGQPMPPSAPSERPG